MSPVILLWCYCLVRMSTTVWGSLQCRCPSGGEGCCTAIERLPYCNPITGESFCSRDYSQWTTFVVWNDARNSKYGTCRDSGSIVPYRNSPTTDSRKLDVSVVTHSINEANITISWRHLNLSFPTGAVVDLRLYQERYGYAVRGSCVTESMCISRFYCTNDVSETSYTFEGAKFNFVNAVQLAVRVNSTTVLLMRTAFASRATDFHCANTDVVEFDIQRCRPPAYGNVTNLTAEVSITHGGHVAVVSWQPPIQHRLYQAPLFYHLVISQIDSSGQKMPEQVFTVRPQAGNDGSVRLSGFDVPALYSVGVRAFVNCTSCKTRAMSYITLSLISNLTSLPPTSDASTSAPPTSAPPISAAPSLPPTSAPPTSALPISALPISATPTPTSSTSAPPTSALPLSALPISATPTPTSSTSSPQASLTATSSVHVVQDVRQHLAHAQVISLAVISIIAFVVLVSCAVISGSFIIKKEKFRNIFCKAKSQVTPQVNAQNKLSEPDVHSVKEPSPDGSPILPLPSDTLERWDLYQQPPHILEVKEHTGYLPNNPLLVHPESPVQEPYLSNLDDEYSEQFVSCSDSASSNYSEYFGRHKVLIIYSPNNREFENVSIRNLSALLANSPELNVVSHELEPYTEAFSNWLMGHLDKEGDDKVHTMLCVWTDTFKAEWNGDCSKVNSDLVAAARKVIDNGSTVSRFKVATIYLDDSIPIVLPTSLNATSKFHISNVHAIKTFIKGVAPFSTR